MRNQINLKQLLLVILLFMSVSSFAQEPDSTQIIKIESGQTLKKYVAGKLESFVVELYAVNYGNALTFTKAKNKIVINDAQEPNVTIKIHLNDKKLLARELLYNNKMYLACEGIEFDINNLPKNSEISSEWINSKVVTYLLRSNPPVAEDVNLDKIFKLFVRLDYPTELKSSDDVFEYIADFFSQQDALLKIYSGSYASGFEKPIIANLKTDEYGKVKDGIIWRQKQNENGQYHIYSNGEIEFSENQSLTDFQQTFRDYFLKHLPD